MFKKYYHLIMNEKVNAFKYLPPVVQFQLMTVLSYMWSALFSIGIGSYLIFDDLVIFHTTILVGIFFTAYIFKKAHQGEIDHRSEFKDPKDGGAMYDDIWGGI